MFKRLYVIGNGFDIHHKINSSYRNFLDWIKINDRNLYLKILDWYDDAEKNEWWNEFESNIGYFDIRSKIEDWSFQNQPTDYDLEKLKSIDTMGGAWDAQEEIGGLLGSITSKFHEWVDSLSSPNSGAKLIMDTNEAFFINFNYTLTLETVYDVPADCILHIHGSIGDDEYIIGHGRSYEEVKEDAEPYLAPFDPNKDDPSEYGLDAMDDEITQNAKIEAINQVMQAAKPVSMIIKRYQHLFNALSNVSKVYIYGMSFSDVDEAYLNHMVLSVSPHAEYEISYYSKRDYESVNKYISKHNLKANLIKLEDKQLVRQLKLFE